MARSTNDEILELRAEYERLADVVEERLSRVLAPADIMMHITHRIKTPESIKGKLAKKSAHYQNVRDLYDILGFRVICYFAEDVDLVAKLVAENFRIDWSRSKDKRELIDAQSFGYLSLHYVCALPESADDGQDLWFELQIRTILQHSWAEIEHDLGYKTEFEVPRSIRRSFSRAASLLETADILFSQIREELEEYKAAVKADVVNNKIDEVYFDRVSIVEFTAHNRVYQTFLHEVAGICGAQIVDGHPEHLLPAIDFLGIRTLKDMVDLIEEEHDLALSYAEQKLRDSGLYLLSSTVGYRYLFNARLVTGGYGKEKLREACLLYTDDEKAIERDIQAVMAERERLGHQGVTP